MTEALRVGVSYKGGELCSRVFTGDCIVIGRESDCDVRLNHPDVSRHHACITRRDRYSYLFRDLKSSNGTFAHGESVSMIPILEGGHVQIADFDLAFHLLSVPWSESDEPQTTISRVWEQDTLRLR